MKYLYLLLFVPTIVFSQQVYINETISLNDTVLADIDSSYSDWIELYNSGSLDVNLSGYYLSDDSTDLYKWEFPNVTIPSNGFLLVCASNKDSLYSNGEVHTNFKLSSGGEKLLFTAADSTLIDSVSIPQLLPNQSYGRQPDGSSSWFTFGSPTLGWSNNSALITLVAPEFSSSAGFYIDSVILSLQSFNLGDTILYTLDGSEPDINNINGKFYTTKEDYILVDTIDLSYRTFIYTGPIVVKDRTLDTNKLCLITPAYAWWSPTSSNSRKSTVVKAKAYKQNTRSSKTVTNTYFVDTAGVNMYSMPVVSISTNEDNFFGYHSGIHVPGKLFYDNFPLGGYWPKITANYTQKGIDWERAAHLEYFVEGNRVVKQNIGVRIAGNVSRGWGRKSFRLYARSEYDQKNKFEYRFFDDLNKRIDPSKELSSFKRLLIRNSGSNWGIQLFQDAFIQHSVRHLDIDILHSSPSVLFVNGEYWGCMNLRERIDQYYINAHFEVEEEDVVILKANSGDVSYGIASDATDYIDMRNFVYFEDMTDSTKIDSAQKMMDIQNFAKLFMIQIYINNNDWLSNNRKCWRKRTPYNPNESHGQDGRYRWFLFDLDHGFKNQNEDRLDIIMSSSATETRMFRSLMANNDFKRYWINLLADNMNTSFLPSRLISEMANFNSVYDPEIPEHKDRWGAMWSYNSTQPMEDFATQRPAYMKEYVVSQFAEVTDTSDITLDVLNNTGGIVKINTIDIDENTMGVVGQAYPWTGTYFAGIPVQLIAKPHPGYEFVEWLGTGLTNDSLELAFAGDTFLTAVFAPIADTIQGVFINEVLAKNNFTVADNYGEYDDFIELYNVGNRTIDVSGLYLTDRIDNKAKWEIPAGVDSLYPGDYLLFWADNDSSQGVYHTNFKLSNETVYLFQVFGPDTILLDQMFCPANSMADISRGRLPDGSTNIVLFDFPTADTTNVLISNTVYSDIYINEFMPENLNAITDDMGEYEDWIELYNAGTTPVDIGGLYLTDDLTEPNKYRVPTTSPDSTTISPGGFLLLWADKDPEQGVLHLDFKLNNVSEQIGLVRYSPINTFFIDSLIYGYLGSDISFGRYPDGTNNWHSLIYTPNGSNVITNMTDMEEEEQCCLVYPNPTSGQLTIEGADIEQITVFNTQGQRCFFTKVRNERHTINLLDYPSGIYILEVRYAGKQHIGKITLR
ncbi:MAG: hypothetical protein ACI976_000779 [Aureispira sp.]|jgi:hypothetical protein